MELNVQIWSPAFKKLYRSYGSVTAYLAYCPLLISVQDQESIYNAKIDVVKKEHEQLLQEAFERAKVD